MLIDFITMGYGIGYVTKLYVEDALKNKVLYEIKVESDTNIIDYGIIILKNNILTSHCSKFIKYLKDNK